jgi:poly(3-hydroxyalkanoate) synthetase
MARARPQGPELSEAAVPLLVVPPTINKYYILDISPGRSIVEWLVSQQRQVFMISWRNPDVAQGHFDLDTYAAAVLEARDAVAEITGQGAVNLNAACSGGIIASGALAHLAAIGEQDKIGALTLMVCALDQGKMGTTGAFANREVAAAAVAESAARATPTAGRWKAFSPGCARTTWSGTTSSTTTCWARTRPHSTSCTGTRTQCAFRQACTETSS